MEIVAEEDFDVTLSGGDPLFDPEKTAGLIARLKQDGRNVWVYTGYTWEQIMASDNLRNAVREADVVVEGPFMESLKNPDLLFRGSSNQRLVDVKASLEIGIPVLFRRQGQRL